MEAAKRLKTKLLNSRANKGFLFSLPWVFINLDPTRVFLNKTWEQCNGVCSLKMSQAFNVTLNLLKPTGHVMHQQFNIQQL